MMSGDLTHSIVVKNYASIKIFDMEKETDEIINEQIIKSIDFELDLINKESARPGWTKWAIYGSFAAAVWLLVSLFESHNFNFINIAQLYLALHFISSSGGFVRTLYLESEFQINKLQKFTRASNFIDFEVIGSNFILNFIDLLISILFSNDVWITQTLIILTALILVIAIQILQFWQLNVEFPQSFNNYQLSLKARLIGFTFGALISISCIWAASGYFFAAYNRGSNSTDFKIALLTLVFSFLFKTLFANPVPTKIKNSLIELRRLIIFNEINGDKAKFELKKIIGKLTPSELIKDFYQDCLFSIDLEFSGVSNSSKIFKEIQEIAPDGAIQGEPQYLSIIEKIIKESSNEKLLEQQRNYNSSNINKLNKDIKRIKFSLQFDDGEVDEMERNINEKYNINVQKYNELVNLRNSIFQKMSIDSINKLKLR